MSATRPQPPRAALTWPVAGAALGALVLWSGTAIANKVAVAHMDPLSAGLLRSMLAGLVALTFVLCRRFPWPPDLKTRVVLLYAGLACFVLWPGLLSLGLGRTTAGHAALIMALLPVFTTLIAKACDRRVPAIGWWLGAAIALAGTILLVTRRTSGVPGLDGGPSLWGDLTVLSGAFFCASGYVAAGRLTPRWGTWATTSWALASALVVLVPAMLLLAPLTDWSAMGAAGWGGIAYMTLGSSLAGYTLWFWALGRGGISRIGTWQFAMPVATLGLAGLILDEVLSGPLLLSGVVILVGTVIAQRHA